jgi:hypothetical protein
MYVCVGHTFPGTFLVFPSSMDRKSSNDMTPSPSTSAACKRAVAVRESIIYIHIYTHMHNDTVQNNHRGYILRGKLWKVRPGGQRQDC